MKILMFGRGAIATIYGWVLEQAGHEVEFYVRPGRAATYGETIDLDLLDARRGARGQRIVQSWPVRYREDLKPDNDFDLIVLSVAHRRLTEAVEFLAPRIGRATVLVFGNVWAEPQDAISPLPADQLAWGFPGARGAFGPDGTLYGGLAPQGVFGTFGQPPSERELTVRRVFRAAGLRFTEQPDFRGWLWIHFIADAGIHSQGLRVGTLSQLAGATGDLREALLVTRELLPLLRARGLDLRRHRRSVLLYRAPVWLTAPVFAWATSHISLARRALQVHSDPDAEEPRTICRDTLAEARRLGVTTPRPHAAEIHFQKQ
ncbi:ketopantoate reductase family protein [Propionibacterium freudenreichii]|uniref:ketopantoate reductase family protein n=1 Tax=Propionibacterium freudenreichii TaxID=1744 RepID=UPI00049FC08F|nr:2-dehydropantoate 2-reductase N-terminal domain-containing protein [Propionibacterium freudenreichii]CDP48224.1 Protein of unknown function [Propionibacterium freudenreichii subsp. freudenreichii]